MALVWAAMVIGYLILIGSISYTPYDGDALMRLQQVRDLLGGQAWFDVTQYRMEPPHGAAMHWSRLIDAPLAGTMLLLRPLLGAARAEYWATVLVPLTYLGAAVFLLRGIMLRLGIEGRMMLAGLGLAVLFPLLPTAFAPMAIDHHSPQALAALAATLLFLHAPARKAALLAGVASTVWLVISLEGLPVVALFAALYGLRYALVGDRSLAWFLGALAVAAPVLSLATRPLSEFALWCDILLPGHWAAFAAAAVAAAVLPRLPGQDRPIGRFLALGLLPLVSGPVALALIGKCAAGPFAALDPLLQTYWYDKIYEGMPVWQQNAQLGLPALYTALLIPAGYWAARRTGLVREDNRLNWLLYTALTAGAALYGLVLLREMMVTQLLALPFAVALFLWVTPWARAVRWTLPRVLATFGCIMLITPAPASLAGIWIDKLIKPSGAAVAMQPGVEGFAQCDFARVGTLPRGHLFTSFNSAPSLLTKTPHTLTVGGYHRNTEALKRVIIAFISEEGTAHGIVRASKADYLVACLQDSSLPVFAKDRPDSLAALVLAGRTPPWLEPVEGFDTGALRVWRVR